MKCLWKKVICGALVAGMLAQCPQSIYAEDAANTATVTDTESNHVTPDTTQQPDDTKQPGDTQPLRSRTAPSQHTKHDGSYRAKTVREKPWRRISSEQLSGSLLRVEHGSIEE